jgi:hypothetical protein
MRTSLIVVVAFSLGACATQYQPQGATGGFTETQLDRNVFRVSFGANAYTSAQQAEEMALLRSAELALKNGFTHFVITEGKSSAEYSTSTTPTYSDTTVSSRRGKAYASTTTYGGETRVSAWPTTTNTITCFKGKPNVSGLVYDARFVFNSLAKKYGVTGPPK